MTPPGLAETFDLLAKAAGVGVVLSFLFESAPFISTWFQKLDSKVKWWIIFVLSLVIPLCAQLVVQLVPPEVIAALEPYWQALAFGFLAWSGSQGTNILFNKKLNGS